MLFHGDHDIAAGQHEFAGGGPQFTMVDWSQVVPMDRKTYLVAFREPAFTPEQNLVLYLFSLLSGYFPEESRNLRYTSMMQPLVLGTI
jgi:hypothetical protein